MREDGRRRVIIEGVAPEIDCGRFAIKRTLGETVTVEADAFADGHDAITCLLLWRPAADPGWNEVRMAPLDPLPANPRAPGNDRWQASFTVGELGRYLYTVHAWVDHWQTWRRDLQKRVAAGQEVGLDLRIGAALVDGASERAREGGRQADARILAGLARDLGKGLDLDERLRLALDEELSALMDRHADRRLATVYGRELPVTVDRERARFSAWYELFPRSTAPLSEPERHGTFRDLEARLPYVAGMGFDVVYLPPIHPIGTTHRKGKNNARTAEPGDVGSPWAIGAIGSGGAEGGGHKAIHPDLGTPADFHRVVERARELGMEVALDVAFQASPDHPLAAEHPEWFRQRPDGTIQYAENPPKKYEDIYPFDFEGEDWRGLWEELKSVFDHWIGEGVRAFRVDNPHTKPFAFWEWALGEIRREHPDVIFLSEAFTRPKVMYRLAKLGFTQSYTYFAWRRHKAEIQEYLTEITRPPVVELFRPSFWPNTPDILTDQLQTGGRAMFVQRFLLAATLTANYGIYGPAFELMEHVPREPGSEEYRDSEKYQLRRWDLDRPDSLCELIAHVNRIRRENPALQSDRSLRFHAIENDQILCYSKATADRGNVILVAVTLDPRDTQAGWVRLDLPALGLAPGEAFQVHDLLTGARYSWQGEHNFVQLDPEGTPAHIFRIQRAGGTP